MSGNDWTSLAVAAALAIATASVYVRWLRGPRSPFERVLAATLAVGPLVLLILQVAPWGPLTYFAAWVAAYLANVLVPRPQESALKDQPADTQPSVSDRSI